MFFFRLVVKLLFLLLVSLFFSGIDLTVGQEQPVDCTEQIDNGSQYVIFFLKVNRYRLGENLEEGDEISPSEQAIFPTLPICAGVRLDDYWVLTTAECLGELNRQEIFSGGSGINHIYKAVDLNGDGVGYITNAANRQLVPESEFALIGLEDPTQRMTYPELSLAMGGAIMLPDFYQYSIGTKCGYISLHRLVDSSDSGGIIATRSFTTPIMGEPLFVSVETSCLKQYMVTGLTTVCESEAGEDVIFFPTLLSNNDEISLNCNSTSLTGNIIQEIRSVMERGILVDTLPAPPSYKICQLSDSNCTNTTVSPSTSWTTRPIWETAQGIATMVGVLAFTAISSGVIGCASGYGCHARFSKSSSKPL